VIRAPGRFEAVVVEAELELDVVQSAQSTLPTATVAGAFDPLDDRDAQAPRVAQR
jgi:hypothetical protein